MSTADIHRDFAHRYPVLSRLYCKVELVARCFLVTCLIVFLIVIVARSVCVLHRLDVVDLALGVGSAVGIILMWMPYRSVGRLRAKLFAICFAIMTISGVVEGYLRLFRPFPILLRAGRIDLPHNTRKQFSSNGLLGLEETVSVSFNSLGFRGVEPPEDWNDILTLVCVGGSTTQCIYLSDGSTWPDVLASFLKKDLAQVWVNNAGIDGHSTFGHLELLDRYLAELKPKWVLFYVGINDVDRHDLTQYDVDTLRSQIRQDDSTARCLQRLLLKCSDSFALADNFRLRWAASRKGLMHGEPISHNGVTVDLPSTALSAIERQKWLTQQSPECLSKYRDRLRLLIDRCEAYGIQSVLVTQPVLYGEGTDAETGVNLETVRVGEVDGWTHWQLLKQYNQATIEVAAQCNRPVIDVARKLPKSSMYFYDLTHNNLRGAREVAKIIHSELLPILATDGASGDQLVDDLSR